MHPVIALFLISIAVAPLSAEPDMAALDAEAQALAEQFIGQLKPQLKQGIAAGGPAGAIEVCAHVAPRIADTLAAQSGWRVRRVSLKSRNASRAVPDTWERSVLETFDQRQQAGENAASLVHSEIASGRYRYMQAQAVAPLCLNCHGEALSEPVRAVLSEYYPDDWATGYRPGQVRGAISLSRDLTP
jgi:hypothetical protein